MADAAAPPPESSGADAEVHPATPGEGRRTLLIGAFIAISGGLLLAAIDHELGAIEVRLLAGDTDLAADRFLWLARISFVLLALVGVVAGALVARGAQAVIREQRYPYAGARLIWARKVVRGNRAVMIGRVGLALAAAFAVVGCVGAIAGWQLLAYFR